MDSNDFQEFLNGSNIEEHYEEIARLVPGVWKFIKDVNTSSTFERSLQGVNTQLNILVWSINTAAKLIDEHVYQTFGAGTSLLNLFKSWFEEKLNTRAVLLDTIIENCWREIRGDEFVKLLSVCEELGLCGLLFLKTETGFYELRINNLNLMTSIKNCVLLICEAERNGWQLGMNEVHEVYYEGYKPIIWKMLIPVKKLKSEVCPAIHGLVLRNLTVRFARKSKKRPLSAGIPVLNVQTRILSLPTDAMIHVGVVRDEDKYHVVNNDPDYVQMTFDEVLVNYTGQDYFMSTVNLYRRTRYQYELRPVEIDVAPSPTSKTEKKVTKREMYNSVDINEDEDSEVLTNDALERLMVKGTPQHFYPGLNYRERVKQLSDSWHQSELELCLSVLQAIAKICCSITMNDLVVLKNCFWRLYALMSLRHVKKAEISTCYNCVDIISHIRHDIWESIFLRDNNLIWEVEKDFNSFASMNNLNQIQHRAQTPDYMWLSDNCLTIWEFAVTVNLEEVHSYKLNKYLDLKKKIEIANPNLTVKYEPKILYLFDEDCSSENSSLVQKIEMLSLLKSYLKVFNFWNKLLNRLDPELIYFARRNVEYKPKDLTNISDLPFLKRARMDEEQQRMSIPRFWKESTPLIKDWLSVNEQKKKLLMSELRHIADNIRISVMIDITDGDYLIDEDDEGVSPTKMVDALISNNMNLLNRVFHAVDVRMVKSLYKRKLTSKELWELAIKADVPNSIIRKKANLNQKTIINFEDPLPPDSHIPQDYVPYQLEPAVIENYDVDVRHDTFLSNPVLTSEIWAEEYKLNRIQMANAKMFLCDKDSEITDIRMVIEESRYKLRNMKVVPKNRASALFPFLPRLWNEKTIPILFDKINLIENIEVREAGHRANLGLLEAILQVMRKSKPVEMKEEPLELLNKQINIALNITMKENELEPEKVREFRDLVKHMTQMRKGRQQTVRVGNISRSIVESIALDCKGPTRVYEHDKNDYVEGYGYTGSSVLEARELVVKIMDYMSEETNVMGPNLIPDTQEYDDMLDKSRVDLHNQIKEYCKSLSRYNIYHAMWMVNNLMRKILHHSTYMMSQNKISLDVIAEDVILVCRGSGNQRGKRDTCFFSILIGIKKSEIDFMRYFISGQSIVFCDQNKNNWLWTGFKTLDATMLTEYMISLEALIILDLANDGEAPEKELLKSTIVKLLFRCNGKRQLEEFAHCLKYMIPGAMARHADLVGFIGSKLTLRPEDFFSIYVLDQLYERLPNLLSSFKIQTLKYHEDENQNVNFPRLFIEGNYIDLRDVNRDLAMAMYMPKAPIESFPEKVSILRKMMEQHTNYLIANNNDKQLANGTIHIKSFTKQLLRFPDQRFTWQEDIVYAAGSIIAHSGLNKSRILKTFTQACAQPYVNSSKATGMRYGDPGNDYYKGLKGKEVMAQMFIDKYGEDLEVYKNIMNESNNINDLTTKVKDMAKANTNITLLEYTNKTKDKKLRFGVVEKIQRGGSREIFVMNDVAKAPQQIVEIVMTELAKQLSNEYISVPSDLRPSKISFDISKTENDFRRRYSVSYKVSLDASGWAPESTIDEFQVFLLGLAPALPRQYVEITMMFLERMKNKEITIEKAVFSRLEKVEKWKLIMDTLHKSDYRNNVDLNARSWNILYKKKLKQYKRRKYPNPEEEANKYVEERKKKAVTGWTLPYSFLMGILNLFSSVKHCGLQRLALMIWNEHLSRHLGKVEVDMKAHSDDSALIVSVPLNQSLSIYKYLSMVHKTNVRDKTALLEILNKKKMLKLNISNKDLDTWLEAKKMTKRELDKFTIQDFFAPIMKDFMRFYEYTLRAGNIVTNIKKSRISDFEYEFLSISYMGRECIPPEPKFLIPTLVIGGRGYKDDLMSMMNRVIDQARNGVCVKTIYTTMLCATSAVSRLYNIPSHQYRNKLLLDFGGVIEMHPYLLLQFGKEANLARLMRHDNVCTENQIKLLYALFPMSEDLPEIYPTPDYTQGRIPQLKGAPLILSKMFESFTLKFPEAHDWVSWNLITPKDDFSAILQLGRLFSTKNFRSTLLSEKPIDKLRRASRYSYMKCIRLVNGSLVSLKELYFLAIAVSTSTKMQGFTETVSLALMLGSEIQKLKKRETYNQLRILKAQQTFLPWHRINAQEATRQIFHRDLISYYNRRIKREHVGYEVCKQIKRPTKLERSNMRLSPANCYSNECISLAIDGPNLLLGKIGYQTIVNSRSLKENYKKIWNSYLYEQNLYQKTIVLKHLLLHKFSTRPTYLLAVIDKEHKTLTNKLLTLSDLNTYENKRLITNIIDVGIEYVDPVDNDLYDGIKTYIAVRGLLGTDPPPTIATSSGLTLQDTFAFVKPNWSAKELMLAEIFYNALLSPDKELDLTLPGELPVITWKVEQTKRPYGWTGTGVFDLYVENITITTIVYDKYITAVCVFADNDVDLTIALHMWKVQVTKDLFYNVKEILSENTNLSNTQDRISSLNLLRNQGITNIDTDLVITSDLIQDSLLVVDRNSHPNINYMARIFVGPRLEPQMLKMKYKFPNKLITEDGNTQHAYILPDIPIGNQIEITDFQIKYNYYPLLNLGADKSQLDTIMFYTKGYRTNLTVFDINSQTVRHYAKLMKTNPTYRKYVDDRIKEMSELDPSSATGINWMATNNLLLNFLTQSELLNDTQGKLAKLRMFATDIKTKEELAQEAITGFSDHKINSIKMSLIDMILAKEAEQKIVAAVKVAEDMTELGITLYKEVVSGNRSKALSYALKLTEEINDLATLEFNDVRALLFVLSKNIGIDEVSICLYMGNKESSIVDLYDWANNCNIPPGFLEGFLLGKNKVLAKEAKMITKAIYQLGGSMLQLIKFSLVEKLIDWLKINIDKETSFKNVEIATSIFKTCNHLKSRFYNQWPQLLVDPYTSTKGFVPNYCWQELLEKENSVIPDWGGVFMGKDNYSKTDIECKIMPELEEGKILVNWTDDYNYVIEDLLCTCGAPRLIMCWRWEVNNIIRMIHEKQGNFRVFKLPKTGYYKTKKVVNYLKFSKGQITPKYVEKTVAERSFTNDIEFDDLYLDNLRLIWPYKQIKGIRFGVVFSNYFAEYEIFRSMTEEKYVDFKTMTRAGATIQINTTEIIGSQTETEIYNKPLFEKKDITDAIEKFKKRLHLEDKIENLAKNPVYKNLKEEELLMQLCKDFTPELMQEASSLSNIPVINFIDKPYEDQKPITIYRACKDNMVNQETDCITERFLEKTISGNLRIDPDSYNRYINVLKRTQKRWNRDRSKTNLNQQYINEGLLLIDVFFNFLSGFEISDKSLVDNEALRHFSDQLLCFVDKYEDLIREEGADPNDPYPIPDLTPINISFISNS